jgi:hypothetical protein
VRDRPPLVRIRAGSMNTLDDARVSVCMGRVTSEG